MPHFELDSHKIYRVPALLRLEWLEHGFGTRHTAAWPEPQQLASLKQIHSDLILTANAPGERFAEGDALVTNRAGLLVGVRTADCVPVLLVDEAKRAVAAVHAGWRGTRAGIAAKTVARMGAEFGSSPDDLFAAIGPCINACCFEVGPEVAAQFGDVFPERKDLDRKTHIDLVEANRRQLLAAGLALERIFTGAPCTFCSPEFHSFRRDATDGRMYSAAGIRA